MYVQAREAPLSATPHLTLRSSCHLGLRSSCHLGLRKVFLPAGCSLPSCLESSASRSDTRLETRACHGKESHIELGLGLGMGPGLGSGARVMGSYWSSLMT